MLGEDTIGFTDALTSDNWEGDIVMAVRHGRALQDSEVYALQRDPYQLLKPATPEFYFTPFPAGALTNPKGPFTHPLFGPFSGPIS